MGCAVSRPDCPLASRANSLPSGKPLLTVARQTRYIPHTAREQSCPANHLGTYGRWAFAEFTDVHEMQDDFEARVEEEFNKMIQSVATGHTPAEAEG